MQQATTRYGRLRCAPVCSVHVAQRGVLQSVKSVTYQQGFRQIMQCVPHGLIDLRKQLELFDWRFAAHRAAAPRAVRASVVRHVRFVTHERMTWTNCTFTGACLQNGSRIATCEGP